MSLISHADVAYAGGLPLHGPDGALVGGIDVSGGGRAVRGDDAKRGRAGAARLKPPARPVAADGLVLRLADPRRTLVPCTAREYDDLLYAREALRNG